MAGSTWVRLGIAVIVGVVWAASYAVSIVNHNYHPPAEINAVMLLVAGYFFASGIRNEADRAREVERAEIRHLIEEELHHERPPQD